MSIYRQGRVWYYDFWRGGKRYAGSTRCRSKCDAILVEGLKMAAARSQEIRKDIINAYKGSLRTQAAEIIWAAGFIDGDGCITLGSSGGVRKNRAPTLSAAQKDLEPLERLQRIFKGHIYGPYTSKKFPNASFYSWQVTRTAHLLPALASIRPFLGSHKRKRCDQVLEKLGAKL